MSILSITIGLQPYRHAEWRKAACAKGGATTWRRHELRVESSLVAALSDGPKTATQLARLLGYRHWKGAAKAALRAVGRGTVVKHGRFYSLRQEDHRE